MINSSKYTLLVRAVELYLDELNHIGVPDQQTYNDIVKGRPASIVRFLRSKHASLTEEECINIFRTVLSERRITGKGIL